MSGKCPRDIVWIFFWNSIYSKFEFEKEFQLLLNNLNGHQEPEPWDYLGFYVELNPINPSLTKFFNST